jgi:hypothetical protein
MIKNRNKEVMIGVLGSIVIALLFFSIEGEVNFDSSITGFASYEEYNAHKEEVLVSGIEFKALVDGKEFYYVFSEDEWYESKELFQWELRKDMGDTMWSGLLYLQSYDAVIYFNDKEVDDISEIVRKMR